jgi:hypothetical protein
MDIYRALVLSVLLAAPVAADCGLNAYKSRISETQAADQQAQKNASEMSTVRGGRAVVIGGGVVDEQSAAKAVAAMDTLVVIEGEGKIMHYREVVDNISEAQSLSAAELSGGLTDKNEALFHTTRLINHYYKDSGRAYTVREVARGVQKAVRSGALCRPDGSLAVTGDFRDIVAKELKK